MKTSFFKKFPEQLYLIIALICPLFLVPDNAWALQSHGAPEGLYVHQMAHVSVAIAMTYWFWDIRRSSFNGRGWQYLQVFCVLMLTWNIVAFIGHTVAINLDAVHISSAAGYLNGRIVGPINFQKGLFYVTKFDHFILVPAFFYLFIGVRSLFIDVVEEESREGGK